MKITTACFYQPKPLIGHTASVNGVLEVHPQRVISWSDDLSVKLWDAESGRCIVEHDSDWTQVGGVLKISDTHVLVWGHERDQQFTLNSRQGKLTTQWQQVNAGLRSLHSLGNGTVLSTSDDHVLRLHDALTGECLSTRMGVQHVGLVTDSLVAGWTRGYPQIRVWCNGVSERVAHLSGQGEQPLGVVLLSDGDLLASWSDVHDIQVWDLSNAQLTSVLLGHRQTTNEDCYQCEPIGGVLALSKGRVLSWSADQTLRVWMASSGECLQVLEGHEGPVRHAVVVSERNVVSWSHDPVLLMWDIQTGQCLAALRGHEADILGFRLLRSGLGLSWSADQTLRLWDLNAGRCMAVLAGHSDYIWGVCELSNGKLASWSEDGSLIFWSRA